MIVRIESIHGPKCLVSLATLAFAFSLLVAGPGRAAGQTSLADDLSELLNSGKLVDTTEAIEQLLESSRRVSGLSLQHAALLDQIASHAIETEQEPAPLALEAAAAALEIKQRELGDVTSDPEVARSMTNLGWILVGHNRFDEAGESLRRALAIQESLPAPTIDLAFTLEGLAWQTVWVSGFEAGEPFCVRALEVYRDVGASPEEELPCRGWIAAARHNTGDLDAALAMQVENIELAEQHLGADSPEVGTMLSELAGTYLVVGDYQAAEGAMERSLGVLRNAVTLHNAADLYENLGWYSRALELAREATALWQQSASGSQDVSVALGLRLQGRALLRLGSVESVELLERALRIARERFEPASWPTLGYLINLGTAERTFGFPTAKAHLEEALAIARTETHRSASASAANILLELGLLELESGTLEESRRLLEESVSLSRAAFGEHHFEYAKRLVELASVLHLAGDLEGAQRLLAESFEVATAAGLEDHPLITRIRTLQSQLALRLGRAEDSLSLARQTLDVLVRQARIVSSLPERHATSYFRSRAHPESVLVAGALELPEGRRESWITAVAEWTLERRARVLEHVSARHLAGSASGDSDVREAWRDLVNARQELARLWVASVDSPRLDQVARALRKARTAVDDAEVALAKLTTDGSATWNEPESMAIPDLQGRLPQGAALVEFVRVPRLDGRDVGYGLDPEAAIDVALIVTADQIQLVEIGAASAVDDAVENWRGTLQRTRSPRASLEGVVASGRQLRRLLWDPVVEHIGSEARRVFVVPDGAIFQVHFAALATDDGRYLVEDGWQIHLLSSARDLVRSAPAPENSGVLAMGAPDYGARYETRMAALGENSTPSATASGGYRGDSCVARREWPDLAGARVEVMMLADVFEAAPVTTHVGSSASEERFKREADKNRWLHLATHGFYDAAGECETKRPLVVGDLGLLRSGLVLAGANGGGNDRPGADDGILTAEEILTLDLRDVEMAVLSACDTGLGGVVVGEGVFGLRRAFEVAGARTVVQSLWPLPDRAAQRFMAAFYSRLRKSADVVAALHDASLSILTERRRLGHSIHPYFWTGLISSGEWQLEKPLERSGG